jgi:hypothetical protein
MPRSNAKQFWEALGHVVKPDHKVYKALLGQRALSDPKVILAYKVLKAFRERGDFKERED